MKITLSRVTSTHHRGENDRVFRVTAVSFVANFVGNYRDVHTSEKVGKPVTGPSFTLSDFKNTDQKNI